MNRYEWSREAWPVLGAPQIPAGDIHRRHVMARLLDSPPKQDGRLGVLGAGPCNDLDLSALQAQWSRVDLVDIDAPRVQQGVAAQVADSRGIQIVTQDLLWGDQSLSRDPARSDAQNLPERISATKWSALGQDYDRIASTCVLSQLIEQVVQIIGIDSPKFVASVQATRLRHLELMASVLRPGGTGWLFCDFVSSETLPELLTTTAKALPQLLGQSVTQGNYFHGLNPGILWQVLRQDEGLAALIRDPQITNPWIWLTGERAYAVCGLQFTRR